MDEKKKPGMHAEKPISGGLITYIYKYTAVTWLILCIMQNEKSDLHKQSGVTTVRRGGLGWPASAGTYLGTEK